MKRLFCALRFTEDENLAGRTYWYVCDFPAEEGESVLAPVGSRNGLQRAVVERIKLCEERDAPYDMRLIKRVEARAGERLLTADGVRCVELGGVKYDAKRYTRFRRVLVSEQIPQRTEELKAYGVARILAADGDVFAALLGGEGCALVCGAGAKQTGETLLRAARGEQTGLAAPLAGALAELLVKEGP